MQLAISGPLSSVGSEFVTIAPRAKRILRPTSGDSSTAVTSCVMNAQSAFRVARVAETEGDATDCDCRPDVGRKSCPSKVELDVVLDEGH